MPRLLGVDIPGEKPLITSLRAIYGIGPTRAKEVLSKGNIATGRRAHTLQDEELVSLSNILQEYQLEGELRRELHNNIKRLISIRSYRGQRHRLRLPVRGQRTRSNARTRKGKTTKR